MIVPKGTGANRRNSHKAKTPMTPRMMVHLRRRARAFFCCFLFFLQSGSLPQLLTATFLFFSLSHILIAAQGIPVKMRRHKDIMRIVRHYRSRPPSRIWMLFH